MKFTLYEVNMRVIDGHDHYRLTAKYCCVLADFPIILPPVMQHTQYYDHPRGEIKAEGITKLAEHVFVTRRDGAVWDMDEPARENPTTFVYQYDAESRAALLRSMGADAFDVFVCELNVVTLGCAAFVHAFGIHLDGANGIAKMDELEDYPCKHRDTSVVYRTASSGVTETSPDEMAALRLLLGL